MIDIVVTPDNMAMMLQADMPKAIDTVIKARPIKRKNLSLMMLSVINPIKTLIILW